MSLGAILTTTNPLNTTEKSPSRSQIQKPVLAFTTRQLLPKLTGSPLSSNSIVIIDDDDDDVGQVPNNSSSKKKFALTLGAMMKRQPTGGRFREVINQDDTATLLYSSGTTGAQQRRGVVAPESDRDGPDGSGAVRFASSRRATDVFSAQFRCSTSTA
ncbi:hypothetical protein M0R45_012276 [Rubus argutus]|uniref:Uncharacterized protein n=1 Tax=Rubus argutus TaxID=59490 RepID=A0AAW1YDT0_RUBAR